MKKMLMFAAGAALSVSAVAPVLAEDFVIPIDQSQSTVTITLTIQGRSATDSSPVIGNFTGELRSVNTPTEILFSDFDVQLTETLILNISFGFLGAFNSTVTDFQMSYANPGVDVGPAPITAGAFSVSGVPTNFFGFLNYNATGLVCTALQGSMLPCVANQDLSTDNPRTLDTLDGTLTSVGRVVTIVSNIDQTTPLDPLNPSLGTVRVVAAIRGSALIPVPCLGDANGDGVVGLADLAVVISNWTNVGAPRIPGDLDEDGEVALGDIAQIIQAWDTVCP